MPGSNKYLPEVKLFYQHLKYINYLILNTVKKIYLLVFGTIRHKIINLINTQNSDFN